MSSPVKHKSKANTMIELKDEVIDALLVGYKKPEDILGKNGLLNQLKKRVLERALSAELDVHLDYQKGERRPDGCENSRNGYGHKKVITDSDAVVLDVPRDRNGSFEPQILPKRQTRFTGFDDKIVALYARGMSVRDIQESLKEIYQVEVSPDLISTVTNEVMADVVAWQSQPLDAVYPIVWIDCIYVKCREENQVRNKAVYLVLAVNTDGHKELLGMWISNTEGAKFWLGVMNELKNRGVKDLLVVSIDGLKGLDDAILAVFPKATIQLCIVHLIRHSTRFVNWKDRKNLCADLKGIYSALNAEAAAMALQDFTEKWGAKYPSIPQIWQRHWDKVIPFFQFPQEIRKVIYTTNAIESLNRSLRKIIKTKGAFPNDDAIRKLFYLAMQNIAKKWTMPIHNWSAAVNQFSIIFPGRFPT